MLAFKQPIPHEIVGQPLVVVQQMRSNNFSSNTQSESATNGHEPEHKSNNAIETKKEEKKAGS
jgi:hypothetical protein